MHLEVAAVVVVAAVAVATWDVDNNIHDNNYNHFNDDSNSIDDDNNSNDDDNNNNDDDVNVCLSLFENFSSGKLIRNEPLFKKWSGKK